MRLLDILLRWHARRLYRRLGQDAVAGSKTAPAVVQADNVYPLW